jgi:hypothetical protein
VHLVAAEAPSAQGQAHTHEFDETLASLQKIIRLHFTWPGRAGELLGIRVLDSLVLGESDSLYSFVDAGRW